MRTKNFIRKERYSGPPREASMLVPQLRQEDIKAAFDNGILKLTVPKEARSRSRKTTTSPSNTYSRFPYRDQPYSMIPKEDSPPDRTACRFLQTAEFPKGLSLFYLHVSILSGIPPRPVSWTRHSLFQQKSCRHIGTALIRLLYHLFFYFDL